MNKKRKKGFTSDTLKETAVMTTTGDYRRGSVFLPGFQQYICTGDYYRTLCTIVCVNGYDDPECGLIADDL